MLKKMVSDGVIEIDKDLSHFILTQALSIRACFSFWYKIAEKFWSVIELQEHIGQVIHSNSPYFNIALKIATCDDKKKACEMLYEKLGIKSILFEGHVPFSGLKTYIEFFNLVELLSRMPTPTVVYIYSTDIFGSWGDFCLPFIRYAALTNDEAVMDALLGALLEETDPIVRETITQALAEHINEDELSEIMVSKLDEIKSQSHMRYNLIKLAHALPHKVRLQLVALCWDDEYRDIREKARASLLDFERPLFEKIGLETSEHTISRS